MEKLNNFITELREFDEADKQLQAAFYFVRDIPYSTINSHSMRDAVESNQADCHAKSQLLGHLFKTLGYETRTLIMQYRLRDYPEEVRFIPDQLDYHYVPQILLNDEWLSVDATYDSPLASIGFVVNDWDSKTATPLTEIPITQKVEGQPDDNFDKTYSLFQASLNDAYAKHADEITSYRIKFNEWLMTAREFQVN